VSKVAQEGRFAILNIRLSLSASVAVGLKLYVCVATTSFAGDPLMTGGAFTAAPTEMLKGDNDAELLLSETLITMLLVTRPESLLVGYPERNPRAVSNAAHAGLLLIANLSVSERVILLDFGNTGGRALDGRRLVGLALAGRWRRKGSGLREEDRHGKEDEAADAG